MMIFASFCFFSRWLSRREAAHGMQSPGVARTRAEVERTEERRRPQVDRKRNKRSPRGEGSERGEERNRQMSAAIAGLEVKVSVRLIR
jgi:hypothetical protein